MPIEFLVKQTKLFGNLASMRKLKRFPQIIFYARFDKFTTPGKNQTDKTIAFLIKLKKNVEIWQA